MSDLAFPPEHAPRSIYVFALDIEPVELPAWEPEGAAADWPLPSALGVEKLDPEQVEVFPSDRIAEYGLARYLTEANGMSPESVAEAAQTLEAQTGIIALVHSRAVAGKDGQFDPAHPARFIGRFSEKTSLTASVPNSAPETSIGVISAGATPDAPTPFPWRIILIALVALVVLGGLLWSLA